MGFNKDQEPKNKRSFKPNSIEPMILMSASPFEDTDDTSAEASTETGNTSSTNNQSDVDLLGSTDASGTVERPRMASLENGGAPTGQYFLREDGSLGLVDGPGSGFDNGGPLPMPGDDGYDSGPTQVGPVDPTDGGGTSGGTGSGSTGSGGSGSGGSESGGTATGGTGTEGSGSGSEENSGGDSGATGGNAGTTGGTGDTGSTGESGSNETGDGTDSQDSGESGTGGQDDTGATNTGEDGSSSGTDNSGTDDNSGEEEETDPHSGTAQAVETIDDRYVTFDRGPIQGNVFANETSDRTFHISGITQQPEGGELTLYSNGVFTFDPADDFSGTDSFQFVVVDEFGNETLADAEIQVEDLFVLDADEGEATAQREVVGNAGDEIDFGFDFHELVDLDETQVRVSGLPAGAILSTGTQNPDGSWSLAAKDAAKLYVRTPTAFAGEFQMQVTVDGAVNSDQVLGSTTQVKTISVIVAPSNDPENFIMNGSFENLTGLTQAGFGHFGERVVGWDLDEGPRMEVHNPRAGVDEAADGLYWLDMDASPGNVVVSQQVLGLEEGKVYDLSFETANSNPFVHRGELLDTASNGLEVFWNGERIGAVLNEDSEFSLREFQVRAGSGDGSNTLTFRATGEEDNVGISLDKIRMTASDNLVVNGSFENLLNTVDRGWGHSGQEIQGWTLENEDGTAKVQAINFKDNVDSYGGFAQDRDGRFAVSDNGDTLFIAENGWKSVPGEYVINENTVVELQYRSTVVPEFVSIGFDNDATWRNGPEANNFVKLFGTQQHHDGTGLQYEVYEGDGEYQTIRIPVGQYYTGEFNRMTFINDDDAGEQGNSFFRHVRIYQDDGNAFEVHNPRGGVEASEGEHWLDLGGSASNVSFSQKIGGVEEGIRYILGFDLADSAHDRTDGIEVFWNGDLIASIKDQDATMDRFEFEIEGGSGDDSNTLRFKGTGSVDNFGVSLDDVSIVEGEADIIVVDSTVPDSATPDDSLTITGENVEDMDGFRIYAQRVDLNGEFVEDAELIVENGQIGVVGTEEAGVVNQIGMDSATGIAEQVVVEFERAITGGRFEFSRLFHNEGDNRGSAGHEQGRWEALNNGEIVASGIFIANESSHTGTMQIDLPPNVTADTLTFTATKYSAGQRGAHNDSSDFFLTKIDVELESDGTLLDLEGEAGEAIDLGIQLTEFLDAERTTLTITGVPQGALLSAGEEVEPGVWRVAGTEFDDITLRTPTSFSGDIELTISANGFAEEGLQALEREVGTVNLSVAASEDPENLLANSFEPVEQSNTIEVKNDIVTVTEDSTVSVRFESDAAGFHNTLGVYDIDPDTGVISNVRLVFANASGVGEGGDLIEGVSEADLKAEAGTQLGFFVVANGDRLNNFDSIQSLDLQFQTSLGGEAAIKGTVPELVAVGPNGQRVELRGHVYHAAGANLNHDGLDHFQVEQRNGELWFSVEDLPNLGDRDFNDLEFSIETADEPVVAQKVLGLEEGKVFRLDVSNIEADSRDKPAEVYWNGELVLTMQPGESLGTSEVELRAGSGDGTDTLSLRNVQGAANDDLPALRMVGSDNLLVNGSFANSTGTTDTNSGVHGDEIHGWTFEQSATLITQENFEGGAEGWSNNTTTDSGNEQLTEFLGKFGGSNGEQFVSKTFDLQGDHNFAVVEFDFLKIDSWDANNPWGVDERLNIFINDLEMVDFTPEGNVSAGASQLGKDSMSGVNGNIRYVITSSGQDSGMNGHNDHSTQWQERIYSVRIEIENPGDELKLGFGSTLNQHTGDESFGIDNVTVFGAENANVGLGEDDDAAKVTISQQVPGVKAGESYKLSFNLADEINGATDDLEVIWNGEVIASIGNQDASLSELEFNVTGGSGDGSDTIKFRGIDAIDSDSFPIEDMKLSGGVVELVTVTPTERSVEIRNPGFEEQVLPGDHNHIVNEIAGWESTGPRNGVWNVHPNSYTDHAPEGDNVAFIDNGGTISQQLTETLQPDQAISLSFQVGDERFGGESSGWEARLYAGNTLLKSVDNSNFNPGDNQFITAELALTAEEVNGFSELFGRELTIEFFDSGAAQNVHFDDVKMTVAGRVEPVVEAGLPLSLDLQISDNLKPGATLSISGLPEGAILTAGTENPDGSWSVAQEEVKDLAVRTSTQFVGEINLEVTVNGNHIYAPDTSSMMSSTTTVTLNVAASEDPDNFVSNDAFTSVDPVDAYESENGLVSVNADSNLSIRFLEDGAGYRNTLGVYDVDPDTGVISNVRFVFENASGVGEGGDLIEGVSESDIRLREGDNVGFFVIADGFSQNNFSALKNFDIEFQTSQGRPATINGGVPELVAVGSTGNTIDLNGHVYHTGGANLNPDGLEHFRVEVVDGELQFGTEDLFNLGDRDFNDVEFGLHSSDERTVSQKVLGLKDGKVYNLTFDLTADGQSDKPTQVYWNGELVLSVDPQDAENGQSLDVRAGSGDGSNTLTFRNVADQNVSTFFESSTTNTSELKLSGEASTVLTDDGHVIQLTEADFDSEYIGGVFTNDKVDVTNFSTSFSFSIDSPTADNRGSADGIAFVIQNGTEPTRAAGGALGYAGMTNSVAIEFDTWRNAGIDQTASHVAVLTDGNIRHEFEVSDLGGLALDNGKPWQAWVDYDGTTLELRLSQNGERPEAATIAQELDIPAVLGGNDEAHIGFTAATGGATAEQHIWDWTYSEENSDVIEHQATVAPTLSNVRMNDAANLLVNGSFENLTGTTDQGWGHNAKSIQGWTLEEAGTLVAQENFEGGAEGWTDNRTTDSGHEELTEFLGQFGGSDGEQIVSKTFGLQGDHNYAVVEFDFLKLDSWDANRQAYGIDEALNIFINDTELVEFIPEGNLDNGVAQRGFDAVTGVSGNMRYVITSTGQDEGMNGRNDHSSHWQERIYKVRIEIENPGEDLKLGFGSTIDQNLGDESFGIDNVTVFGTENPKTSLQADGSFSAAGNHFEVHNPRGGVEASDGEFWLDMGGSASNVTISQQVPSVEAGETYKLSFDLADSIHDTSDGLEVIWNGEVIAALDGQDATMDKFEFNVTGGSGDGSNTIKFRGTGDVDNFGVSLDNVELVQGEVEIIGHTGPNAGTAGNGITLGLEVSRQFATGDSTLTLTGIPEGAALSSGAPNPDGSWTVAGDQVESLTLRTPTNFSGDLDIGVKVSAINEFAPEMIVNGSFETAVEPIAIENPGFQADNHADGRWSDNTPGWEQIGSAGDWDPNSSHYAKADVAEQVAWANTTSASQISGFAQNLSESFDTNKSYELSVDIGNRTDGISYDSKYEVRLIAGDTIVGVAAGSTRDIADGTFRTANFNIDGRDFAEVDGQSLRIEILNTGTENNYVGQVNFDNVRLMQMDTATTDAFRQTQDGTVVGWGVFNEVDGWKTSEGAGIEVQERVAGSAAEGEAHIELDSHNNSGVYQDVQTAAGQDYQLSFQYSPRPGVAAESNGVEVYWNGELIDTLEAQGGSQTDWNTFNYTVEGNGETGRIEFKGVGREDSLGGYIDDVSMQPMKTATDTVTLSIEPASNPDNYVVNGSFENIGDNQLANNGWKGLQELEGWNLDSGQQMEVVDSGHRGVDATDGETWLDMDASPGNIQISQDVLGLTDGLVYTLSFDTITTPGQENSDNGLDVFWNGEKVGSVGAAGGSQEITIRAGDGDGSNKLTFTGTGTGNGYGLALDNIEVVDNDNLVLNGSFENLVGLEERGFGFIGQNIQGWTLLDENLDSSDSVGNRFEVHNPRGGVEASDGEFWLDMGGSPSNVGIAQHLPGVQDGVGYQLSFDLADSAHDSSDGLDVIWNGEIIGSLSDQDATMDTFDFALLGGSGDGSNTLTFRGTGNVDNFGVSLDNIKVQTMQRVEGSGEGDFIGGANRAQFTQAGSGNDTISSGAGSDAINAGDGDDIIMAGKGADVIDGGEGRDQVAYWDSQEGVSIDLENQRVSGGTAEGDRINSIEDAAGSNHDDTITGSREDNRIRGGDGDDVILGGEGNDVLNGDGGRDRIDGGEGFDRVDYSSSNTGVRVNLQEQTAVGGTATGDKLSSIEGVDGSNHDDILDGSDEANVISGNAGDDTIKAGAGNDVIDGGKGDDTIDAGEGHDIIDGGDGYDVVKFAGGIADYEINVDGGLVIVENTATGEYDVLQSVEKLRFADGHVNVGEWVQGESGVLRVHGLGETQTLSPNAEGSAPINLTISESIEALNAYETTWDFEATPGGWENSFFVFDYNGPEDFKYVGARVGADYWTVGEYNGKFNDLARLPENIPAGVNIEMRVSVDNGKVALEVDGEEKVKYNFLRPFASNAVGVANQNAETAVRDFSITSFETRPAGEATAAAQAALSGGGEIYTESSSDADTSTAFSSADFVNFDDNNLFNLNSRGGAAPNTMLTTDFEMFTDDE